MCYTQAGVGDKFNPLLSLPVDLLLSKYRNPRASIIIMDSRSAFSEFQMAI